MLRRTRTFSFAALASAAVIGLTLVAQSPASAGGNHGSGSIGPKVIAEGLDNPRQLSFTRSGDLLVAEAGEGGTQACQEGPEGPEGGIVCFGATGAVTKITDRGRQSRIITGLPSIGGKNTGAQAIGPSDLHANRHGIAVLIGLGADPAVRDGLPAPGQRMGTLIQTTKHHGKYRTIADLAAWEAENDPIHEPDSNPVGLLYDHGSYLVTDAGGNTLLKVNRWAGIRELAVFPDGPSGAQAVPTSVAVRGHDGAYYVSQLTGVPFPKGGANIFRVDPRTGSTTVYASGLTNVTDLAFDGRTLYAVQLSTEGLLTGPIGSVVEVKRGGTVPADHTIIAGADGELFAPYGIAIKGGYAYVTTGSVVKDEGEVLRIRL